MASARPRRAFAFGAAGASFAIALAVRALYLLTAHGPAFLEPLIDADYYDALGTALAEGRGWPHEAFWQPPLYPALLGALYGLFGHTLLAPRLVQVLLGSAVAFFAASLAERVSSRSWVPWVAGLAVALNGSLVFYDGELLSTSLGVFLGTFAVWLVVGRPASVPRAVLAGVSVGLGALAVAPTFLLVVPVAYALEGSWRVRAAAVLACVVSILPATFFNHAQSGEWIPISSNGGVNLFLGNNGDPDTAMALRPGAGWEELMAKPADAGAHTAGEQDAYFVHRALEFCVRSPGRCVANFVWKARLLLVARELPRNESLDAVRGQSPVLEVLTLRLGSFALPYALLWPLGALGVWALLSKRTRAGWALLLATFVVGLVPLVFFVTGRYRAPLAPLLAVLAALGCELLGAAHGSRRLSALGVIAAVAVVSLWPIHLAVDAIDFPAEMDFAIAGRRQRLGDLPGAIDALARAEARRPDYLEAQFNLGLLLERAGRPREAVATYERLLAHHPEELAARIRRAGALVQLGELDVAEAAYERMLEESPRNSAALLGLARIALARNEPAKARGFLGQARAVLGPNDDDVRDLESRLGNGP